MPELRPYQISACEDTLAKLRANRRPILVLPTGAGKSVCAQAIANRFLVERPGSRVLFLAHRRELVVQLAAHLERSGLRVGIIKAGFPSVVSLPVQVASIDSLARRQLPPADLLIFDECHHAMARTWRRLSESYPDACQMGMTATPWRLDGRGLGAIFSDIVVGAYADDLCRQKFLIEPRVYRPAKAPILKGVHRRGGDYAIGELAKATDTPELVADVVESWMKFAKGVPTVGFAVNVGHSQHIVAMLVAAGVRAEHCDGETPEGERDAILGRLSSGATEYVSNVGLFGEGFDLPKIKCVDINRPTESHGLYLQMIGRAARPTPDGSPAIVIDHPGLTFKFGRMTDRLEYSLDGEPEAVSPKGEGHGLKTCPGCFRMVLRSRTACPECGHVLVKEREIPEYQKGELVCDDGGTLPGMPGPEPAFAPQRRDEEEEAWRYIEETRLELGKLPGWSVAEFRRRFGRSPAVVTLSGMRVLVTRNASEPIREAAWRQFKAEASAQGKVGGAMYGYAASRCVKLFGSVPAAAKQRAKQRAVSARAERKLAKAQGTWGASLEKESVK